jgi:hypothetical protein
MRCEKCGRFLPGFGPKWAFKCCCTPDLRPVCVRCGERPADSPIYSGLCGVCVAEATAATDRAQGVSVACTCEHCSQGMPHPWAECIKRVDATLGALSRLELVKEDWCAAPVTGGERKLLNLARAALVLFRACKDSLDRSTDASLVLDELVADYWHRR